MDGSLPIAAASRTKVRAATPLARRIVFLGGGGVATLAVAAFGLWWMLGQSTAPVATTGETARAVRERMVVTVTESGEIDASKSTNVTCEVDGQSTIVWVIEEGTHVKAGDELIKLDSADLQERVSTQDMAYKTSKAAYEKAAQDYLITQSQRESQLSSAALTVKFSLMDLKKYLGKELAERVIGQEGKAGFDNLARETCLSGAALQSNRKFQTDIDLAGEELSRAASKVEWTRTLKEKGYVTGSELQADELAYRRQQVAQDEAKTALDLFLLYDLPKAAEKAYTDWMESKREFERVDARTKSLLESAKADRDNKKEALALEETRLKKVQDQLAKTTIKAPGPGMVVYDTGGSGWTKVAIETGATVRHQQNLIKLPDMAEMNVKVKLHESVVKMVAESAPAFVTIDAFPKDRLTGKVTKVAVMPDRSQWWLNPGLKAYITEITLDSTPAGLKPGMSAEVEILVDTRDGVLQVPISAVFVDQGFQVVYVKTPTGIETRRVDLGLSNDRVVEITKGLKESEEVYLFKPPNAEDLKLTEDEMKAKKERDRKPSAEAKAGPTPVDAGLERSKMPVQPPSAPPKATKPDAAKTTGGKPAANEASSDKPATKATAEKPAAAKTAADTPPPVKPAGDASAAAKTESGKPS